MHGCVQRWYLRIFRRREICPELYPHVDPSGQCTISIFSASKSARPHAGFEWLTNAGLLLSKLAHR